MWSLAKLPPGFEPDSISVACNSNPQSKHSSALRGWSLGFEGHHGREAKKRWRLEFETQLPPSRII